MALVLVLSFGEAPRHPHAILTHPDSHGVGFFATRVNVLIESK
jgi:hypothetical protein